MDVIPGTAAGRFATVARLCDAVQNATGPIIARAHAARRLGATARRCRSGALELERQASRAEKLLFSQVVATFRAAMPGRCAGDPRAFSCPATG